MRMTDEKDMIYKRGISSESDAASDSYLQVLASFSAQIRTGEESLTRRERKILKRF